jgi:hypothetical protein
VGTMPASIQRRVRAMSTSAQMWTVLLARAIPPTSAILTQLP